MKDRLSAISQGEGAIHRQENAMSARNWVDKLRGLLQRDDSNPPKDSHLPETAPQNLDPIPPQAAPVSSQNPKPPRRLHKIMPGTLKEQTDWSLRQIASVGDHINSVLKAHGESTLDPLARDKELLKIGYAVVTLALKAKQTEPPAETLRSVRLALKNALLSALRKGFHKQAPSQQALGASMVELVEGELTALDKEVQVALSKAQDDGISACENLKDFLSPLIGEDKALAEQLGQELEKQVQRVFKALPIQDLLV